MDMNKKEWNYEESRLNSTLNIIERVLLKEENTKEKFFKDALEVKRSIWNSMPVTPDSMYDLNTIVGITQNLKEIKISERDQQLIDRFVKRLKKMRELPYFGRFDFIEAGSKYGDEIYLGISTLIDSETNDIVIYDWRAPVSSMFYENELGNAEYNCPEGVIEGEITLKRQFRILNGKLKYMFDSSVKIDDDILQQILSGSADDRMRTIVTTIQKEQNKIIRDESSDILIVQGPAGSGKTSIALHRTAYFLYKYSNKAVTSENIVIFSPNDLFNDYISNVLPELGEENTYQTTFIEYAKEALPKHFKIEDMNDQMEFLLSSPKEEQYALRVQNIQYKSSMEFIKLIKSYVEYMENQGVKFKDIVYRGKVIKSKEELEELFYRTYSKWNINDRLKEIKEQIFELLKPVQKERIGQVEEEIKGTPEYFDQTKAYARMLVMNEFKALRNEIDKMLSLDSYKVYCELIEDKKLFLKLCGNGSIPKQWEQIRIQTLEALKDNVITYEDLAPILYIKYALGDTHNLWHIKFVVMDEAQDYSPFQYEILKQLFPKSNFTILGDLNQSIHPYINTRNYNAIAEVFKGKSSELLKMNKSYRSTKEIVDFTKKILKEKDEFEGINRNGDKPKVIKVSTEEQRIKLIGEDIVNLHEALNNSIAVICKTADESLKVYNKLKAAELNLNINLITKYDDEFKKGVSIIPSYLSKGLEFDAVIIHDGSDKSYKGEEERRLFYTICTRALHKLNIYYKDKPSEYIMAINKEVYNLVDNVD